MVRVLLPYTSDEKVREKFSLEIQNALSSEQFNPSDPSEWIQLTSSANQAEKNLGIVQAHIIERFPHLENKSLDERLGYLNKHESLNQTLYQANLTVKLADEAKRRYCSKESIFIEYIEKGLGGNLWLGYEDILLIAESKNWNVYIWVKEKNELKHIKSHEIENPSKVVHLLHTAGFTHFNRLKEVQQFTSNQDGSMNLESVNSNIQIMNQYITGMVVNFQLLDLEEFKELHTSMQNTNGLKKQVAEFTKLIGREEPSDEKTELSVGLYNFLCAMEICFIDSLKVLFKIMRSNLLLNIRETNKTIQRSCQSFDCLNSFFDQLDLFADKRVNTQAHAELYSRKTSEGAQNVIDAINDIPCLNMFLTMGHYNWHKSILLTLQNATVKMENNLITSKTNQDNFQNTLRRVNNLLSESLSTMNSFIKLQKNLDGSLAGMEAVIIPLKEVVKESSNNISIYLTFFQIIEELILRYEKFKNLHEITDRLATKCVNLMLMAQEIDRYCDNCLTDLHKGEKEYLDVVLNITKMRPKVEKLIIKYEKFKLENTNYISNYDHEKDMVNALSNITDNILDDLKDENKKIILCRFM